MSHLLAGSVPRAPVFLAALGAMSLVLLLLWSLLAARASLAWQVLFVAACLARKSRSIVFDIEFYAAQLDNVATAQFIVLQN